MNAGTLEATPLAVDFATRLRDVITDCDELTVAMKAVPEKDPLSALMARLRLKVACLRSSACGASAVASALHMTGQPVVPAQLPPAPQAEPAQLHEYHQVAHRRAASGLSRKDLAAGEKKEVDR